MLSKLFPTISRRSLSLSKNHAPITCRGKSISHEEVFQYNNGHFLVNESYQYSKRYIRFNIDKLCELVASVVGNGSSVSKIVKMEGGFHKALLMTLDNGIEVIAKIPCPNAGMPMHSTASEAAVLEFIRTNTMIPVPKVFAWSSDSKNPVGAEYIIMENAPGIQLNTAWGDLSRSGRLRVIESLVHMEKELSSLQFPAYGNLYFRHSIPKSSCVMLSKEIDPSGLYCIGPVADPAWLDDHIKDRASSPKYDTGPWMDLQTFGQALAKRSLLKGFTSKTQISACQPPIYGSPSSHTSVLEAAVNTIPSISNHPILVANSAPVLLHTDLHMGNLFVTEEGAIKITSIIDWHSTTIAPKFIQSRWPIFLEPLDGYQRGMIRLEPPSGLEQLDAKERERALFIYEHNYLAKAYEVCTARFNSSLHNALAVPQVLKEIYIRCGETLVDGIFPLQSCLIDLYQGWKDLGFTEPCPLYFTEDELARYNQELPKYEEWYALKELVKRALDTDSEGWISPELDWDEKQSQNRELFRLYIDKALAENKAVEDAKAMWPFPTNSQEL